MPSKTQPDQDVEVEPVSAPIENRVLEFDFRGQSYEIDLEVTDDVRIAELFELGKTILACKRVIGAAQWELFMERNTGPKGNVPGGVFSEFLDTIQTAMAGARDGIPN